MTEFVSLGDAKKVVHSQINKCNTVYEYAKGHDYLKRCRKGLTKSNILSQ